MSDQCLPFFPWHQNNWDQEQFFMPIQYRSWKLSHYQNGGMVVGNYIAGNFRKLLQSSHLSSFYYVHRDDFIFPSYPQIMTFLVKLCFWKTRMHWFNLTWFWWDIGNLISQTDMNNRNLQANKIWGELFREAMPLKINNEQKTLTNPPQKHQHKNHRKEEMKS